MAQITGTLHDSWIGLLMEAFCQSIDIVSLFSVCMSRRDIASICRLGAARSEYDPIFESNWEEERTMV